MPERPSRPLRNRSFAHAMRALGGRDLPPCFVVAGASYAHEQTVKHDFWAATGFYRAPDGRRAVLKVDRVQEFAGLPLEWIGRWLCRREVRFYRLLQGVRGVPRLIGTLGPTGFIHEHIPGAPLSKHSVVADAFFDRLLTLMAEVHARGIAYVDTNKPQNILLGDDGEPWLIDFQISFDPREIGLNPLSRALLRRMQREDVYHLLKHKRRLRPDQLTEEERGIVEHQSWAIRLHRFLTRPYFRIRRRLMKRWREGGHILPAGSD